MHEQVARNAKHAPGEMVMEDCGFNESSHTPTAIITKFMTKEYEMPSPYRRGPR